MTQPGSGALTLTGNNTYTGSTTITSGTLQIGAGGTTDSITTTSIADNGALVYNRSDTVTFSGTVSGTGSLTQAGSGLLTLTGNNTYTGSTTITSGTLQLGNGGTTGSITTPSIVDNGALVYNRSDIVSFAGIASGTGSLMQAGSGVLTLTGNNTYTGLTTIISGTLQLGNGGTTGAITGNVENDGVLVFNRSDGITFSGSISGTGSVIIGSIGVMLFAKRQIIFSDIEISDNDSEIDLIELDAGLTLLTGDHIYSGNTTINSGRLQLGNGGTTGSITANTITNDAVLVYKRSDAVFFPGNILGIGSMEQAGGGVVILTGNNTYTGSTTISSGTLQLGNGGTTGSIATTNITDNGVLVYKRSDVVTFSGVISGTGSLTQAGTGILTLTGNNTYSGNTEIISGTLQLGNGGTTGSITTNRIINDAALIYNRSDAVIFSGIITGSGSVIQIGSGTTTLTGNNNYTGGTEIVAGTLMGSTASLQGVIVNNADLVFAQSSSGNFNGTISSTGKVTINSAGGKVNFNTPQLYTGETIIEAGWLSVNTELASSMVTIQPSGILSGSGTLAGSVVNSGVLSPGNSAGTLTIQNQYTQNSNGALIIQLEGYNLYDRVL